MRWRVKGGRAPVTPGIADTLLTRCGLPTEAGGPRTQHPVVMDGLAFPSVRAAATFAGVSAQTFYMALHRGRTRAKGHEIRYAEEEA